MFNLTVFTFGFQCKMMYNEQESLCMKEFGGVVYGEG